MKKSLVTLDEICDINSTKPQFLNYPWITGSITNVLKSQLLPASQYIKILRSRMENVTTAKDAEDRLDKMLLDLKVEKEDHNERRKTAFVAQKETSELSDFEFPDENLQRLKTKEMILNIREHEN